MAQASGILSSVSLLDEGRPAPQVVPSNTPTKAGRSLARALPAAPLFRRFVLRFRDGSFLHSYRDDGIRVVASLQKSKTFINAPEVAANILGAEIIPILCRIDGKAKRACLRFPSLAVTATARDKDGEGEKADQQACIKTEQVERNERNEVNSSHGEASNTGTAERRRVGSIENGALELDRTRTRQQAKTLAGPSTSEGKKLFFEFVSLYLGVDIFSVQPGYKNIPDQYLFRGPQNTTMAIGVDVMLLDRESALALIREKVAEKEKAFEKGSSL